MVEVVEKWCASVCARWKWWWKWWKSGARLCARTCQMCVDGGRLGAVSVASLGASVQLRGPHVVSTGVGAQEEMYPQQSARLYSPEQYQTSPNVTWSRTASVLLLHPVLQCAVICNPPAPTARQRRQPVHACFANQGPHQPTVARAGRSGLHPPWHASRTLASPPSSLGCRSTFQWPEPEAVALTVYAASAPAPTCKVHARACPACACVRVRVRVQGQDVGCTGQASARPPRLNCVGRLRARGAAS